MQATLPLVAEDDLITTGEAARLPDPRALKLREALDVATAFLRMMR